MPTKEKRKAAGQKPIESRMLIPREITYAKVKKPRIIKVVYGGKRWEDVTDYWIPY